MRKKWVDFCNAVSIELDRLVGLWAVSKGGTVFSVPSWRLIRLQGGSWSSWEGRWSWSLLFPLSAGLVAFSPHIQGEIFTDFCHSRLHCQPVQRLVPTGLFSLLCPDLVQVTSVLRSSMSWQQWFVLQVMVITLAPHWVHFNACEVLLLVLCTEFLLEYGKWRQLPDNSFKSCTHDPN